MGRRVPARMGVQRLLGDSAIEEIPECKTGLALAPSVLGESVGIHAQ